MIVPRFQGLAVLVALLLQSGDALAVPARGQHDLLVVGCGVLGQLCCTEWKQLFPDAVVVCETNSDNSHDALRKLGVTPALRAERSATLASGQFNFVVFCAPPGASGERYPDEVRSAAAECWSSESDGAFVFTSSGAVFAENDGGVVTEASPLSDSPRASRLLQAEAGALEAGGSVIRLAGLYTADRGAHNYWLTKPAVDSDPRGLVNQIHYEDAAGVTVQALLAQNHERSVWLASDDEPLTRVDVCRAALKSPRYSTASVPEFTGTSGPMGKRYDASVTRRELRWEPKHKSFREFMAADQGP